MIKKRFAKLTGAISLLLISGNLAFAQTNTQDVVKAKYPQTVSGELAISEKTIYNKALKNQYRDLYQKLQTGIDEIDKFSKGGADAEILSVFELKDLKDLQKSEQLNQLTAALKKEQSKIAHVMREEKYGADSAYCIRNLSMYSEFLKQKNYNDAYNSWTVLFSDYPTCSSNIYQGGVTIVKDKINNAKDPKVRELWIDTLMMVYDQRIKYFASSSKKYGEGYILGRKGVDLLSLRKQPVEECYKILTRAIDLEGEETETPVFLSAMQSIIGMYEAGSIDATIVVDKYLTYNDLVAKQRSKAQANNKTSDVSTCDQVIAGLDQLFSNSTAAKCETLDQAFSGRFKANPEDLDLLKKIVNILDKKGCQSLQLYEDATTKLVAKEPGEMAYYNLGRLQEGKGKKDEAITSYEKAVQYSTNDTMKAIYYYSAAVLLHKQNKFSQARTYAYKSAELKPGFGNPYILIAVMYASSASSIGESAFEHSQVYWLVIDKLQKAKSVDPSIANEANKLINSYAGSCPNKEEAFMHSVTAGQTVRIGGWIGESTTSRF